jgi:hypothetical protein
MNYDQKGMFAPFTILTSVLTGICFPLLGSTIALDLQIRTNYYIEGLILVVLGGFVAQWILAHTIHDLYHISIEPRVTLSIKHLKNLLILSLIILFCITLYLTLARGWPILIFAAIGLVVSLYAEGLFHHEYQMAIGAMFLVIGSFYVQTGTLFFDFLIWMKVISIALFAFFSQYGWLLIYRLDDYKFSDSKKNKNILLTKLSLVFLIFYFIL